MYESYWQLAQKPFENTADPRFYYPGEAHQGAVLKLRYAVENRRGAAVLAGPSGSGKTVLVQLLLRQLGEACRPQAHVVFPRMPSEDLLAYIADELGASAPAAGAARSIENSVRRIQSLLIDNANRGRHAVLIIDEAQTLDAKNLESLRLLLNFEVNAQPALTLILVGQAAVLPMLERAPSFEERMSVKCLLRPFQVEETICYVNHRLQAAGAKRTIFEQPALESLHALSQGLPRRINRLGDLALLIGYAEDSQTIRPEQLESIAQELVAVDG